jgi:hypothetical protein
VILVIYLISTQLRTNRHCSVIAADRGAELNWLKTLVKKLADKVNALGDTPEARLGAVEDLVDEVALHGVRLGTTLGLAAMATHTDVDYSTRPRGFHGGASTSTVTPLPIPFIPSLC